MLYIFLGMLTRLVKMMKTGAKALVSGGGRCLQGNLVPRVSLSPPPRAREGGRGERDPGNEVVSKEDVGSIITASMTSRFALVVFKMAGEVAIVGRSTNVAFSSLTFLHLLKSKMQRQLGR